MARQVISPTKVALLAVVSCLTLLQTVQAQTAMTNTQRILLLDPRISNRTYQRYLYALPALNQSQFHQQQLYRERLARQQALAEQRRIQSVLSRGYGTRGYVPIGPQPIQPQGPVAPQPQQPEVPPEILTIWNTFGVLFRPADPTVIQQAAPAYRAGMEVVGVKSGGPAANAGWKQGDIVLGLGPYRTENSNHVAYVAQTPSILKGESVNALILRDGTVYTSPVEPAASVLPSPEAEVPANAPETR